MSVASPVIDYIDPSTSPRRIYLLAGVREYHPVDDIYKEVRQIRQTDEAMRPYDMFVSAGGNVPKNAAGTSRTPRYAIFNNTVVVPANDADHDLRVTGEQLFAPGFGEAPTGAGPDCIDKTPLTVTVNVDYTPPEAEVIVVGVGSAQDIRDAMRLSPTTAVDPDSIDAKLDALRSLANAILALGL